MGYMGSKAASGAYQAIIACMPPHDTYIEAFLGGGAVMQHKPPAAVSIGIDMDERALYGQGHPDHVELIWGDAVAFLEQFDFAAAGRVVVYADPPYLLSTRTSKKRYRHDFTDADHVRLLRCLKALPCPVILSGYPSDLYDRELAGWRTVEFQVMTRGGPRTEKLWLNFPAGAVNWSKFAGRNFRERERIKRKAARWRRMYAECSEGERAAILASLLESHSRGSPPAAMVDGIPHRPV